MPPLVIDPAVLRLQQLADSTDWPTQAATAALETASRVYAMCPPAQRELAGADAAEYLKQIVPLVQTDILEQHKSYGPIRWIWYLRRAPAELFEGSYETTLGYDRMLAEALSSNFTADDRSQASNRVAFRIDGTAFRHLTRYVGRVKLLSQLHMFYRRVGKGATLDVSHPIFMADTSEAVEQAIRIYDQRHDRSNEFEGAGLGLTSIDPDFEQIAHQSATGGPTALLSMACSPSFPAPVTYPDGKGGILVATVQVNHKLEMLNLAQVVNPFEEGAVPEYVSGIAALVQLLMLLPTICAYVPWALSSIVQQGYFLLGERNLRTIVDRHLPEALKQLATHGPRVSWPANVDQWSCALAAVNASLWPLSGGNVLRHFNDNVLIDTTGASYALLNKAEFARSPIVGNLRARTFELQCQDLIDKTAWAPPPGLRALRGRTLRQAGRALTDVDTIGVRGRTLLLVSCKSIIYDRSYDRGDFRVVRNTQTTVDRAVVDWTTILTAVRRLPKGDNYDFTNFDEIFGVVCTPFVAYSSENATLAFVKPNLRACSSIRELKEWLVAN